MEEAKGVAKHVLLATFKDGTTPDQIDQLIKGYANLVNLIEPMKSFHWGKDLSIENMHQGFTHVFESTFESTEGIAEYVAHPAHVEFANLFLANSEKANLEFSLEEGKDQLMIDQSRLHKLWHQT